MSQRWTTSDPRWLKLDDYHRAALMSLMERDGSGDTGAAQNIIGAMVNRAKKDNVELGDHVGQRVYQPSFEPSQQARINSLMKSKDYEGLATFAKDRWNGAIPDNVDGATHYLAPESTMRRLEAREPSKYKNWGPRGANWTGYGKDPDHPNEYAGVITRDGSHAFLAPDGRYSAPAMGPFQDQSTTALAYATPQGGSQAQNVSDRGPMSTIRAKSDGFSAPRPLMTAQAASQPKPDAVMTNNAPQMASIRDSAPTTYKTPKIDAPAAPFAMASNTGKDSQSASASQDFDLGDIFGSLGGLGGGTDSMADFGAGRSGGSEPPVDTSPLQASMAAEEERRKRFQQAPFSYVKVV